MRRATTLLLGLFVAGALAYGGGSGGDGLQVYDNMLHEFYYDKSDHGTAQVKAHSSGAVARAAGKTSRDEDPAVVNVPKESFHHEPSTPLLPLEQQKDKENKKDATRAGERAGPLDPGAKVRKTSLVAGSVVQRERRGRGSSAQWTNHSPTRGVQVQVAPSNLRARTNSAPTFPDYFEDLPEAELAEIPAAIPTKAVVSTPQFTSFVPLSSSHPRVRSAETFSSLELDIDEISQSLSSVSRALSQTKAVVSKAQKLSSGEPTATALEQLSTPGPESHEEIVVTSTSAAPAQSSRTTILQSAARPSEVLSLEELIALEATAIPNTPSPTLAPKTRASATTIDQRLVEVENIKTTTITPPTTRDATVTPFPSEATKPGKRFKYYYYDGAYHTVPPPQPTPVPSNFIQPPDQREEVPPEERTVFSPSPIVPVEPRSLDPHSPAHARFVDNTDPSLTNVPSSESQLPPNPAEQFIPLPPENPQPTGTAPQPASTERIAPHIPSVETPLDTPEDYEEPQTAPPSHTAPPTGTITAPPPPPTDEELKKGSSAGQPPFVTNEVEITADEVAHEFAKRNEHPVGVSHRKDGNDEFDAKSSKTETKVDVRNEVKKAAVTEEGEVGDALKSIGVGGEEDYEEDVSVASGKKQCCACCKGDDLKSGLDVGTSEVHKELLSGTQAPSVAEKRDLGYGVNPPPFATPVPNTSGVQGYAQVIAPPAPPQAAYQPQGYAQAPQQYQPATYNYGGQGYSVRPTYGGSQVRNTQFYPFGCGCPTPQPCCNLPMPCCLPQLPCCPKIPCCPQPPVCCQPVQQCCPPPPPPPQCCPQPSAPPCFRSCPSCPCRRRVHASARLKRQASPGGQCVACSANGQTVATRHHVMKRQAPNCRACSAANSFQSYVGVAQSQQQSYCTQCSGSQLRAARVKRFGCIPCLGRKKREIEEERSARQKRSCLPCLNRQKRQAENCRSCNNLSNLLQGFESAVNLITPKRGKRSVSLSWCQVCTGRRKRQAEQCQSRCNARRKRAVEAAQATQAADESSMRTKKQQDFDSTFQCDRSCCDYSKCKSLRAKKFFF